MNSAAPRIVIVGASLAGLTLALACARRGVAVHVLERAARRLHGGDSLSVDLNALAAATGHDPRQPPTLPVVPAYRDRHLTAWPALYAWLRSHALATPGITLDEGCNVTAVRDCGDHVAMAIDGAPALRVDAAIGADGYHSLVRRSVAPQQPLARYAGYTVWRGLVEEKALAQPLQWPSNGGLWIKLVRGYRLVAAVLPGRDGKLEVGNRQITFAWFDAHRTELLRHSGRLTEDGGLVGSLAAGAIVPGVRAELLALVPQLWPATWAEAVSAGLRSATALSGAPIAEYRPERLANGRLALVGDAAHVVTPMTGSGYATSVDDAIVLARLLAEAAADAPISAVLARYQAVRLPYVRGLVAHSQRLSAEYLRHALTGGHPARFDTAGLGE